MALPISTTLESLPIPILRDICEYIDDDTEKRRNLWAFSLTSRYCYVAATAQRLCQIQLKIPTIDAMTSILERWNDILSLGDSHCCVRRLKVLQISPEEAESDDTRNDDYWSVRHSFGVHNFCCPSKSCIEEPRRRKDLTKNPEDWLPLARFISQLPALQDFVWAIQSLLPRNILSVLHARNCRLHIHHFHLRSLVQSWGNPQPVDPDEYAVATSPSLYSIVTINDHGQPDSFPDYTEDAVLEMVAGAAPNLAHVWNIQAFTATSIGMTARLDRLKWQGFFPGKARVDQPPKRGNLQSLVFTGYDPHRFREWCDSTDITKLQRLVIPWGTKYSNMLADMALRGDFKSLDTLEVCDLNTESDESQEVVEQLFTNLNPLRRLYLSGYIRCGKLHSLIQNHGATLRDLSVDVNPALYWEWDNPAVVFTEAVVQKLAEQCPNLEQIRLHIERSRGDDRETGIYRALSHFPKLRRVLLHINLPLVPDEETWYKEKDFGSYPLYDMKPEDIPHMYLRQTFSNFAIDATLARSIFHVIASGSRLEHLRLLPVLEDIRYMGTMAPIRSSFVTTLRWLYRPWICYRDIHGSVMTSELDLEKTTKAGEKWKYMDENPDLPLSKTYTKVFHDLWPSERAEWWNDWKSLPLSEEK